MNQKDIKEELKKLGSIFPNKYIIDFYEAKEYLQDKTGVLIDDSIFEGYLIEKGYRNIVKRNDTFSIHTTEKTAKLDGKASTPDDYIDEEYDIEIELDTGNIAVLKEEADLDFEDMDIDDILDIELKPNTSRTSENFINISAWTSNRRTKHQYSYADNIRLIKEYKLIRDANLLEMILELNIKMVKKQAIYYSKIISGRGLTTEDLVQEGCLGLMKAIDRFDTEKGYEFSTYAMHWINQVITRAICDKDMIVRLPVHLAEQISKVMRYESKLLSENGEIIESKLCSELGITSKRYNELKKYNYQFGSFASLDKAVGEDDTELLEFIGGKNIELIMGNNKEAEDPSVLYDETELREVVLSIMDTLKDRERKVIEYRFGLLDGRPRTLEEIGRIFNVTRERVRQIESKTIRKLRHPSRSKKLKIFISEDADLTVKKKVTNRVVNKDSIAAIKGEVNRDVEVSVDKDTEEIDVISELLQPYSKKHKISRKNCRGRRKRAQ